MISNPFENLSIKELEKIFKEHYDQKRGVTMNWKADKPVEDGYNKDNGYMTWESEDE